MWSLEMDDQRVRMRMAVLTGQNWADDLGSWRKVLTEKLPVPPLSNRKRTLTYVAVEAAWVQGTKVLLAVRNSKSATVRAIGKPAKGPVNWVDGTLEKRSDGSMGDPLQYSLQRDPV